MASTLFSPGTVVRSIWLNEVDKATHNALTAVAGTNTITATGPLTSVAYVTGDRFFFVPAITNTGTTTININGLGAKNLTKYGVSALVAGDLVAGTAAQIYYDGVQFQLQNPQTVNVNEVGRLLNTQTFIASGTYTPTAGTTRILVKGQGAGGAGGGAAATGAGQISVGAGGGAGGIGETFLTAGFSGTSVTIGAGGAGVSGAAGNAGAVTTFGAFLTLNGGAGGSTTAPAATAGAVGALGGTASGGTILNLTGNSGGLANGTFTGVLIFGGGGGSGHFGGGASGSAAGAVSATGRGAGGGGAANYSSAGALTGGSGSGGILVIYEYS